MAKRVPSGRRASHVVIGGGVQGLSAAWRLAERGADVLVLEKDRIGAGASGIAGGVVRNYYRSPAVTELIRRSVEIFEADPDGFGFHQVGYLAAVPEEQVEDLRAIRGQHEAAGYDSELVVGAGAARDYMTWNWPDWRAPVEAVLRESRGGWADAMQTVRRLAERARAAGAEIAEGVEVTGFDWGGEQPGEGPARAVLTSEGPIGCEAVVAAPGPWIGGLWRMLGGPAEVEVAGSERPRRFVEYWKAQEGQFALPGVGLGGRAGIEAPVVHLDQTGGLRSDRDGRELVPGAWGIYFHLGRTGTGVTGGGLPVLLDEPEMDPYGPENPEHAVEDHFPDFFTSGLAVAFERFRGRGDEWQTTPAGGIVPHTPDNYPVCDWAAPNAYVIVDSGHSFKMLALGRMVADDIVDGGNEDLAPYRFARFAAGETHIASAGPYPWT
ncbi:MAG: FAD-binding oxidoreductase [Actinobacteria bacterium]|nr:FAD-binding oxidoreductase [Actinomycetota bacterium]